MSKYKRGIQDLVDWRFLSIHLSIGGLIGLMLLHPLTMVMIWMELKRQSNISLKNFVFQHSTKFFSYEMLLMSGLFLIVGGFIGVGYYYLNQEMRNKKRRIQNLESALNNEVQSLLLMPENESLEFKSSLRWDLRQNKVNKNLERVILKTTAGFANHKGGSLLIGVDDNGNIVGLDKDYKSLKHKNQDGFYQLLMNLISQYLGAEICSYVSIVFHKLEHQEIAQLIVSPPPIPVFFKENGKSLFYLRTGNTTRELDAQEMLKHISSKNYKLKAMVTF